MKRVATFLSLFIAPAAALAQETDLTQTPNLLSAGIKKSLLQQISSGRGDLMTPGSSRFLIARDPFRAIVRGRQLFQRKFTLSQGLGPRAGDGIGNISVDARHGAGLADSCAACHGRPRGSAGHGGVVFTRPDSRDAPHLFGIGLVEMLADEMTAELRQHRANALASAASTNAPVVVDLTAKGVSFGRLRALPDGSVDTAQVAGVDPDLRIRPFFAQGGEFSVRAFAVGALEAEMGLTAFDPDLLAASAGGRVTTPAGLVLDGALDRVPAPPASSRFDDPDGDGVLDEASAPMIDFLEMYLLNYFRPATYRQAPTMTRGRLFFSQIGCAACHVPDLVVSNDRRVADVDTVHSASAAGFNSLFATASARFSTQSDGSTFPSIKVPSGGSFVVTGIFSDLKRHDLGPGFHERNFDGTVTREFVTEPLWGVGTTAPYGHDGRSTTLREVILRHGGEAQAARDAFAAMSDANQEAMLAYLGSLILFPPPDTASNLDPGDRNHPSYPREGHGSIDLSVLFEDPTEPE